MIKWFLSKCVSRLKKHSALNVKDRQHSPVIVRMLQTLKININVTYMWQQGRANYYRWNPWQWTWSETLPLREGYLLTVNINFTNQIFIIRQYGKKWFYDLKRTISSTNDERKSQIKEAKPLSCFTIVFFIFIQSYLQFLIRHLTIFLFSRKKLYLFINYNY